MTKPNTSEWQKTRNSANAAEMSDMESLDTDSLTSKNGKDASLKDLNGDKV